MSSWLLPAGSISFWLGLTASKVGAKVAPGWALIAIGFAAAAAGVSGASPAIRGDRGIETAGLIARLHPAARAVAPKRHVAGGTKAWAVLAVLFGLVYVGAGWGAVRAGWVRGSLLSRISPTHVEAAGTLRTDPAAGRFGWFAQVGISEVRWSDGRAGLREVVWVNGNGDPPTAVRGDRVSLTGLVEQVSDPSFAGSLLDRGISVEVRASSFTRIGPSANPLVHAAQSFRAFVGRSIEKLFPRSEAGLLLGLALGDAGHLDAGSARAFQATGLGHLLVVSGENVAMVLAPMLGLASLLKITRWPRFALAIATVAFFVVMTGAEPSVMRAGAMAVLTLSAVALGRQRSAASILSASVLILIVFDPWLVWSIGFQLSVAATAGIVGLAGPIAERLRFVPSPIALSLSTSLAAQLGVGPVLLYHFHELPGITLFANLAAFPAVSPALLLGLAAGAAGLVWTPLGELLALVARIPLRYLELLAEHLAKAPVAWITSNGGIPTLIFQIALLAGIAIWLRSGWRPPRFAIVSTFVLIPLFMWSSALSAGPPSGLVVRFIDVGQGDGALITSAAGVHVLIDAGPDPDHVATELESLGVRRLDMVVETHPHADHIAGLPSVLTRFPVGLFVEPGCPDTTALEKEVEDTVSSLHIPERFPRTGSAITVGDLRFDVLSPDRCWSGTNSDPNNDSVAMMVHDGEDDVLMSGDAEREAQQVMLDGHEDLAAEVLKCPHHGGNTSLPEWFEAVHPDVTVVSVGQPNPYGHPSPVTLQELATTGARILRTDQHGDVVISFSGQGIQVRSER